MPLSQVHYHFGSKGGLMLALLEAEDRRRLARQEAMYAEDKPLWQRYEQACDFLEDDLESGYVRVLQEMIAAGWSTPAIRRDAGRCSRAGTTCSPTSPPRPPSGSAGSDRSRRRSGHPDRQRVHRRRGRAAARLRPPTDADPRQPAPRRPADPRRRGAPSADRRGRAMRALARRAGDVDRDGVRIHWDRYGDGDPRSSCCRRGRCSPRPLEVPGAVPRPPLADDHLRRAGPRAVRTPRRRRRAYPPSSTPPTPSR